MRGSLCVWKHPLNFFQYDYILPWMSSHSLTIELFCADAALNVKLV